MLQCVKHFLANGVSGSPGKVLTDDEAVQIGEDLGRTLLRDGLVIRRLDSQGEPVLGGVQDSPGVPVASPEPPKAHKGKKRR